MKRRVIGITLLIFLLGLLAGFPFLANIFSQKSISVDIAAEGGSPFFIKDETSQAVLVYFGYVGCLEFCTPVLNDVAFHYMHDIKPKALNVSVYFVSLNPETPPEQPDIFAKAFHPEFHGIYATNEQIDGLAKLYNIVIGGKDSAIGHSSHLYLFKKTAKGYVLKNIYPTNPIQIEEMVIDIKKRAL